MSKVTLGQVATEVRESTKDPAGLPIVGLEHLIPGEIRLTQWSETSENTFTKLFHKGQVLFGRRRAYQKKAAVADFDGVCSGDITVIAAKPDRLLPDLLPFIVNDDRFFDFAMEKSAGSLSPRVKWAQLAEYAFDLPDDIEEQRSHAKLLWAIERSRSAYQNLLSQMDELVKSQFVEMFESEEADFPKVEIQDACVSRDDIKCGPFGTQLKQAEYQPNGIAIWGIPQINSEFSIPPDAYVSPEKAKQLSSYSLIPGDIAMSRKGNVGQCAIFPDNLGEGIIASDVLRIRVDQTKLLPRFMQFQLHHSWNVKQQILRVSDGAVMAGINVTKLKTIEVFIPPLSLQRRFVSVVEQTDKSKYDNNLNAANTWIGGDMCA